MDKTEQTIKELEQQYQLTKNENWLVLKMDLEEQDFKSKCKELLNIYESHWAIGLCAAVLYDDKMLNFIKELKPFVSVFLKEIETEFTAGYLFFFYLKDSSIEQDREIRINFLKWLINL